jgi:hypothetical protein
VSTYSEIRTRVVELLGEYSAGAAEANANASYAGQTIYNRIRSKYQNLVDHVAKRNPEHVADITDLTYAADSEYVDLSAGAAVVTPSLEQRPIISIVEKRDDTRIPLNELTARQYRDALVDGVDEFVDNEFGWYRAREKLFILEKPTRTLTLRVEYVATIAALTYGGADDAATPELLPDEHHELLAYLVALSFKGETEGDTAQLERAIMPLRHEFNLWASGHKPGPRIIR